MINKVAGDTIIFEANLTDSGGTAVTSAVGSITVVDGVGSTVLATNAPHTASGTYQRSQSTSGWGNGPITETWRFTNSSGTTTMVANNNFRIVGTDTVAPYVYLEELPSYYSNIVDYTDGSEEAQLVDAYWEVNSRLEAMGIKLPFKPKADGFYDQPLRDLNAYEALIRIISKRQQSFNRTGEEDPWFMAFRKEADRIYKAILNKEYNFDRDYSVSEGGIGLATKVVGTSNGQMETNWRGGVGDGFYDSSYERDWVVRMVGTGTAGEIGECSFVWSRNGGISNDGTFTTSLEWQELGSGVYIRFHRGTYEGGTINLFAVSDKWKFKTYPRTQTVGGRRSAQSY